MHHLTTCEKILPQDFHQAVLIGRLWLPGSGPVAVMLQGEKLIDLSSLACTTSGLLERADLPAALQSHQAQTLALLPDIIHHSPDPAQIHLMAPCDLQAIKAAGVTFVASMLERVIEEQARGDASRAEEVRQAVVGIIGDNLRNIVPGSDQALQLKQILLEKKAWSQYLEVGIGPDAEIFTKAQPMSAVGPGAEIGIHPKSEWNNPEPEIVLAVNSQGKTVGASLGNDVNLRDFEGRSALLLGKAKDNNGSCAIGPFIRLFDNQFTIDTVRQLDLQMRVQGTDGFELRGESSLSQISRDPLDLVQQAIGPNHQYPDGMMLFLGTMFAPTQDRPIPGKPNGQGFTHQIGDRVEISTPSLGCLINRVNTSDQIPPWTYGVGQLLQDLVRRQK
jgi:fumarylacetoacetate (FAA) hydrolase family protein